MAGGRDAFGAGVRGDVPRRVDQRHLPHLRLRVGRQEGFQRLRGGGAGAHVAESERPKADVHPRLRGDRADARNGPRHDRADLEVMRLHRDAELACLLVAGDDRVGHQSDS